MKRRVCNFHSLRLDLYRCQLPQETERDWAEEWTDCTYDHFGVLSKEDAYAVNITEVRLLSNIR